METQMENQMESARIRRAAADASSPIPTNQTAVDSFENSFERVGLHPFEVLDLHPFECLDVHSSPFESPLESHS